MLLFEENWEKFLAVFFTDGHSRNVHSAVAEFPSTHLHMSTNNKTGSATAEMLIQQWPELKLRW